MAVGAVGPQDLRVLCPCRFDARGAYRDSASLTRPTASGSTPISIGSPPSSTRSKRTMVHAAQHHIAPVSPPEVGPRCLQGHQPSEQRGHEGIPSEVGEISERLTNRCSVQPESNSLLGWITTALNSSSKMSQMCRWEIRCSYPKMCSRNAEPKTNSNHWSLDFTRKSAPQFESASGRKTTTAMTPTDRTPGHSAPNGFAEQWRQGGQFQFRDAETKHEMVQLETGDQGEQDPGESNHHRRLSSNLLWF